MRFDVYCVSAPLQGYKLCGEQTDQHRSHSAVYRHPRETQAMSYRIREFGMTVRIKKTLEWWEQRVAEVREVAARCRAARGVFSEEGVSELRL